MGNYDELIKVVSAGVVIIGGLYSAYYRLKNMVKELRKDIEQEKITREKDIVNAVSLLQRGLQQDIKHLQDDMTEHKEVLSRVWDKLDTAGTQITKTLEKLDSHIQNQEKICKLNHRWNGNNRRKD